MMSDKMIQAVNKQINAEMYSAYLYMAMEEYFQSINLKGFANWMKMQAGEEWSHASKFRDYLNKQNARVILTAIGEPPKEWASPLAVFEAVVDHEKKVTAAIRDLMAMAKSENDYATEIMLQWFVTEQVEEEESALEIVEKLKKIKDSPQGLFMLDGMLGQRK